MFSISSAPLVSSKRVLFAMDCNDMTHRSVKGVPGGASEYQFYRLLEQLALCNQLEVHCFHKRNIVEQLDGVWYHPTRDFPAAVRRCAQPPVVLLLHHLPKLVDGGDNIAATLAPLPRVLVWMHDCTPTYIFDRHGNHVNIQGCHDALQQWQGLELICVSHSLKNRALEMFGGNPMLHYLLKRPIHVVHNVLHEDELGQAPVKPRTHLVYASAWNKGIHRIIQLFERLLKLDSTLCLELLTPGYEVGWMNNAGIVEDLRRRFTPEQLIIHPPLQRSALAPILANALVVLTPPFWETFGCLFAEAVHLGTPVLVNKESGAVAEVVRPRRVVDYNDVQGTWEAIQEIQYYRNPSLAPQFKLPFLLGKWHSVLLDAPTLVAPTTGSQNPSSV